VFFWVSAERLDGFLNVYRDVEHDVFTVNTASLARAHADNVRLSAINSGAALRPNGAMIRTCGWPSAW
jgi:hypothetical protein